MLPPGSAVERYGYLEVFARQVRGWGGDLAIRGPPRTSERSRAEARISLVTIAFTRSSGSWSTW